jgi:hypothetical protein
MPQAVSFQPGGPTIDGLQIWVNYNTNNLRITTVEWVNTSDRSVRARIWNNGSLVYDQIKGPGSGTENVPGNNTMVNVGGILDLPANLTYHFEVV